MPPCVGVRWVSRYGAGSKAVVKGTSRKGETMAEIRSISTNMQPDFWVYSCEEARVWPPPMRGGHFAKVEQQEIKGNAESPGGTRPKEGRRAVGRPETAQGASTGQDGAARPGTGLPAGTAALRPELSLSGAQQHSQTRKRRKR